MVKPKISVIIPIYNTEQYLEETLLSVVNQTMIEDIEVLMINDGSTDNSRYIAEKYALDYENFYTYHKENEGQAIARNFGIEHSNGEYIAFLDSDDYIPPNAYEKLYNLALKNNSDMVCGNALRFSSYNVWRNILFKNSLDKISKDLKSTNLNEFPQLVWDTAIWNKLYKKEFLIENNLRFPKSKIFFEDLLFSFESYFLANTVTLTKDTIYYWRSRKDNTSVTQQNEDMKNFTARLNILKNIDEFCNKYQVNKEIRKELYLKWVNHDLRIYIKRFNNFPEDYSRYLFDEIYEVVNLIPREIIDGLNTYKRVVFEMILNKDFDNFVLFAPLENELFKNPVIPDFLNEKYSQYFNFFEALNEGVLTVDLVDMSYDDDYLYIDFEGNLNYLSDENYEISAMIIEGANEYSIEVLSDNSLKVPLSLLFDKNNLKIKISYDFGDFQKETFLKNRSRTLISFSDYGLEFNIGAESFLFLDIKPKSDNLIEISDISFDSNEFTVRGFSKKRINSFYIENIMNFERISYSLKYFENNEFIFTIPFNDLLNVPIKKWDLNSIDSLNSINLEKNFFYFVGNSKIIFFNDRNKILIHINLCNYSEEFQSLHDKNVILNERIIKLKEKNKKLKTDKSNLKEELSILENKRLCRNPLRFCKKFFKNPFLFLFLL